MRSRYPDHDNKIAKSGAEQAIGEAIDRGPRCFDEAATQRKVLDRVAGEHHLGKQHQVGAGVGGLLRPVHHKIGVGRDITDGGIDLGHGDP